MVYIFSALIGNDMRLHNVYGVVEANSRDEAAMYGLRKAQEQEPTYHRIITFAATLFDPDNIPSIAKPKV